MPKEKPILFSTPMVRAILAGRKTMTRRVAKGIPTNCHRIEQVNENEIEAFWGCMPGYGALIDGAKNIKIPYQVGDILWVRETWQLNPEGFHDFPPEYWYVYKASQSELLEECAKWRPSIHMPRDAARLFLKVKSVRLERLQDITEEDAKAEGCIDYHDKIGDGKFDDVAEFDLTARDAFCELWNSINSKRGYGWDSNPWCWVIEFEREKR